MKKYELIQLIKPNKKKHKINQILKSRESQLIKIALYMFNPMEFF